ncbi:MAG: fumarylacetoacetate hydrolase family protein [Gammaproteobacteria bacterium]|nr:fumarylacetoacetate hydrolase family protein [Gammaproteobacteria bacterium]
MRLASFKTPDGNKTIGAFQQDCYVDLNALSAGDIPNDMIGFLEQGDEGMDRARRALAGLDLDPSRTAAQKTPDGRRWCFTADEVELMAPVPRPGKIMHTSCNFDAHLEELTGWNQPEWQSHNWGDFHFEHPTGFLEAPSSVVASGAKVAVPHFTRELDYEIEIGIIIGKRAFRVKPEEAMDYVAGYTIFNDLSARDIQAREHSNKVILLGKSFDGSCPFGPHLVTVDELSDPHNLEMKLKVNGDVRQDSNTSQMHYKTAELVSWWSNTTLEPGDIITSGSPPGVAAGMAVPDWLEPGDRIDADVAELGTLTTHIVASA